MTRISLPRLAPLAAALILAHQTAGAEETVAGFSTAQPVTIESLVARGVPFPEGEFRLDPVDALSEAANEFVQGEPNFRKVASLAPSDPNFALSTMVGQLWMHRGEDKWAPHCTGFLVGPQIFMTNYHCAADYEKGIPHNPQKLVVAMEHLEDGKLGPKESITAVSGVIKLDYRLDYALLFLGQPLGERYGWLQLERDPRTIGATEAVKIIQHPQGRSKEIVLEDTKMVQQTPLEMHYLADTQGGSSGSPVFALDGSSVIGLHHAGIKNKYNEGLVMARIAAEIALYLPKGAETAATTQNDAPEETPSFPETGAGGTASAGANSPDQVEVPDFTADQGSGSAASGGSGGSSGATSVGGDLGGSTTGSTGMQTLDLD